MSAFDNFEKDRYPGFSSFKTLAPVYYPKRWMRMALIRATLATEVTAIASCPEHLVMPPEVDFSFVVMIAGAFRHVLLTDFSLRQLKMVRDGVLETVSRAELGLQPSAEVARQIWACSRVKLDPAVQVAVLNVLRHEGETTMTHLAEAAGIGPEATRQVLAMAAQGLLQLDMENRLGPLTKAKPLSLAPLLFDVDPKPPGEDASAWRWTSADLLSTEAHRGAAGLSFNVDRPRNCSGRTIT